MDFLAILGCETHCKSELRRNQLRHGQAACEIFSIKRRFRRSKSRFLGSRKPAHEGIKERYPRKSCDEMAGDRLTVCEQELL